MFSAAEEISALRMPTVQYGILKPQVYLNSFAQTTTTTTTSLTSIAKEHKSGCQSTIDWLDWIQQSLCYYHIPSKSQLKPNQLSQIFD